MIHALFVRYCVAVLAATSLTAVHAYSIVKDKVEMISRRNVFASSVASVAAGFSSSLLIDPLSIGNAANADVISSSSSTPLTPYEDKSCKFSIDIPSEWAMSENTLPDRRKIILYFKPDSNQKILLFIAYTPVRDDFTSLGSFGSVDEVGQSTILPKSEVAGIDGVKSNMISAVSNKQAYFFDYVQTVPPQPETHFRSIFSLANGATGGAGSVLVTITVQSPEADYDSMKPLFTKILDSYQNSK